MKNLMTKTLKTLAVAGMTMGLALGAQADTVACTNCLTFSADKHFGIRMLKLPGKTEGKTTYPAAPTVNLEYSTDQVNWQKFEPYKDYPAGADHKLYLRGTNNTAFASPARSKDSANTFTNTADSVATAIACSGNVETLLDYTKVAAGEHPTMGAYAFSCLFRHFHSLTTPPVLPATTLTEGCYWQMFSGCWALTEAPALPATTLQPSCYDMMFNACRSLTAAPVLPAMTLTNHCYYQMFQGCLSLTAAPALPAKTMTDDNCYSSMFLGCTSLTDLPDLPATTLAKQCYAGMFNSCPALVVNTNAPGKAWWIPAEAATSAATAERWSQLMFTKTSGNITQATDAPVPGKTYYIASAPVEFRVTEPEHATFQAYTNGAPVSVPFTGDYLTDFAVTYTAAPGYVFPDGKAEFTTNITERAETVMVTLTADQQPVALPQVEYLEPVYNVPDDSKSGIKEWKTFSTNVYQFVTNDTATLSAGWWVVDGTVIRAGITVSGAAHLILKDGCSLTAAGAYGCAGITVAGDGNSLAIYGQTLGTGQLIAKGNSRSAGIGGGDGDEGKNPLGKNITINGGTVTATGDGTGAGIGGGGGGAGQNITINGGTVTATGAGNGAGIGGGSGKGENIVINGGTVRATAAGTGNGAGIGGSKGRNGENITINGGEVTATGGDGGAGIGGGAYGGVGQNITISGGTVTAMGGNVASAIGKGYTDGNSSNITVHPDLQLKADGNNPPETVIEHASGEDIAGKLAGQRYATIVLLPTEPISSSPTLAPANATLAVYTNGVLSADGTVWSNRTAEVVYRANAGYYFANGATAITNKLDTSVNPAANKAGEVVPTSTGTPKVQLGVVAQRYPWNGTLDVQYRAQYTPTGTPATITVTANGTAYTQDIELVNGTNTAAFTNLPAGIRAKNAKMTLKLAE